MQDVCRQVLVMSLGSERDDVWGEDESQEQGTSDTIELLVQVVFPPEIPW